jgi:peptidoglycan/LPS O-acetylase OafA/YrhL
MRERRRIRRRLPVRAGVVTKESLATFNVNQKRLPQLDGIRGIAILLVIFHNETSKFPSLGLEGVFENGWMGVDLFFVLSGFLITGILLDARESEGYFRNFYARRFLRIWPLYYVLIFLMFVVVPYVRPSEGVRIFERSSPWWSYPLYLQNFLVPAPTGAVGLLGVTWSLAIEEQFYLVWPLVVRFCSNRLLGVVAGVTVMGSPLLRLALNSGGVILYSNTFARLDGLMAGALLAIVVRRAGFAPSRFVTRAWVVLCVATPLALLSTPGQSEWIVFSLSAAASLSLVYLSLFSGQKWLQWLVTNRFIAYTGTISYGLYLLHKLPFNVVDSLGLTRYTLVAPVALAACYGLAALSYRFFERPFLRLKRFFGGEPEQKVAGQKA